MTHSTPRPADGWRPPAKLAAVFFATFVAVQVAVPLFQLTQPRPTRFGWQMYSTVPLRTLGGVYVVEDRAGRVDTVRVADHLVRGRWEMDYTSVLPPHLCAVTPDAAAVVFERAGTVLDRYECP